LLVVEVVTDIIDKPFQHALSKLGVMIHQGTVLRLRWCGFTVAVGGFTVTERSKKLQNRQKSSKRLERKHESRQKAADDVLKCEEHSHHQDGDVPSVSLAEGGECEAELLTCD
jgi:hypothetical protein